LCIETHSAKILADGSSKLVPDPPLWTFIWPVFGAANQMLGAIALLLITLYLKRRRKPLWYTGIPAVFLAGVTATGLFALAQEQVTGWVSGGLASVKFAVLLPAVVLLALALAILFEGVRALRRAPGRD
jgi:carbon starvation protein